MFRRSFSGFFFFIKLTVTTKLHLVTNTCSMLASKLPFTGTPLLVARVLVGGLSTKVEHIEE
ncbi:hypothetical protein HanPSC8_Chr16g0739521 [Helianthus annuus]|nr:hypothetical protein HanPSC8_Chr16g0739521 [Helianthus annuus]